MSWDPDVEQRPHPFGEAGVRSSLEEVCKRAAEGASELLGNPKHLARVRTWAIERLHRAKQRGEAFAQPGDRARILLKAIQTEKLWVPDPIGIEYIPKAHLMACDGDTHDDGTPCVKGDDCDGQIVLLAACFMAVGLYTMIVGHSYERNGTIGHVLTKVYFNNKWHYADPSPLGSGKHLELGKSAPFTRERYYSMPTIKVVCDAASCDVRNFDPQELGFVEKGTFVGLNGIAVMEMPPVVEWLGAARAPVVEWLGEAPILEWLGAGESKSYKADDPLSKAIIANKGDTSEASLKIYGTAAGSMGGAALGSLFGPGGTYVGAVLGGLIGGVIASYIPVAKGSDIKDVVATTWKTWNGPNLKSASRAMLGVKAYYVMRDEAISKAMAAGATEKWAEDYLNTHGMQVEPSKGRWAPKPERYNHPLSCVSPPCASVQSLVTSSQWEECGGAKALGIKVDCREYVQMTWGPWPPIAAKGDTVDWGLIAWDEIVLDQKMPSQKGCDMFASQAKKIPISCPSDRPSNWARSQIIKLKMVEAKMLYDLKNPSTGSSSSSGTGLKVVLGGAALAAAIWAGIAFL